MELVKHETCLEYFRRRLSEGWECVSLKGHNAVLLSPEGIRRELDLRNDVETLRPSADGDETNLEPDGDDANWKCVDDVTPDDASTFVKNYDSVYKRDLYELPASSGSGTINSVTIHFRCSRDGGAPLAYAKPSQKSGVVVTDGSEIEIVAGFNNYSQQYNDNPEDAAAWEWADIDALQIGVSLKGSGSPSWTNAYCTQVYVEVDYTPAAPVEQAVGGGAVGMASTLGVKVILDVGGGAVGMASALGVKVMLDVGDGSIGMSGTLLRLIKVTVGGGAVGMAATLGGIKRFIQAVGGGAVGMSGTLSSIKRFVQGVGGGAIGMTGTLGRNIYLAVGGGSVGMTGTVNTLTKVTVGGGAVGMAGSLLIKIKVAVGEGAIAIVGALTGLFIWHLPVVKIDGVQVIILRNSLLIDMRIEERSIAEFTIIDKTAAAHYVKGQPVQIWDNGNHLTFGGVIDEPEERRQGSGLYHHIFCVDNHYKADKRIVAESYEDTLAGDIVKDIRTTYLAGEGVTVGVIQDGPTLKQVVVNYARASEAFDALAEKANFIWEINELSELNFIDRATNAAPWVATELEIIRGSANLSHGSDSYRNRQFVRGGKGLTSQQVENRTGDGEQDSFAMGYPLAKVPVITVVDRGAQTVGIKGIDTGKDWYWNKGDPVVTADVPPEDGKAIVVTYYGEFNIIILSEDEAAIIDRQTVEGGGTGYVDNITRDPNLTTIPAAFETAAKKLQRYAVMGRKLTYKTHKRGLYPGQLQTVNYPKHNLSNAEMLIESVKVRGEGKLFTYTITAIEGPEAGSWTKFFQHLVEAGKTIDRMFIGEEGTLIILVQKSEEWGWNEAIVKNVFACPVPSTTLYPQTTLYPC